YAAESDLAAFAEQRRFPILPCRLCGSQENAQRKQMKALLAEMERKHPTLRQTMLAALGNVNPSHLYDRKLYAGAVNADRGDADVQPDAPVVPLRLANSRER